MASDRPAPLASTDAPRDAGDASRPGRRGHRRADLVAALAPIFAERGYDGATLTLLASTTGLGKASLYHHFPGGKAEMAAVLLRDAVARIEAQAFAQLAGGAPAPERLADFVDGFRAYVEDGARPCLIA
ncbi:MAG: TetR/AcrR family transcriptional regulator, partial [Pirellulales bacterium]|nr:TetR/AcrR family transcriptional regulator [Pirellulales bacterium]